MPCDGTSDGGYDAEGKQALEPTQTWAWNGQDPEVQRDVRRCP